MQKLFCWRVRRKPKVVCGLSRTLDVAFSTGDSHDYVAIDGIPFSSSGNHGASLVTVIRADGKASIDKEWLRKYIGRLEKCDVYDGSTFLTGLVVESAKDGGDRKGPTLTKEALQYLAEMGNEWVEFIKCGDSLDRLPPGPYLYADSVLKSVLRLFADKQAAFLTALRPWKAPEGEFTSLSIGGDQHHGRLSVAVPSKAASCAHPSSYLAPLRIVVKDCYFLKGMKNSLCNSSYYDFSDEALFTAAVVDSLVKDGAQVLALAKLSTMIAREEPMDAVDFLIAFNPRGDGYQSPAGSSSGSAVAVASYDFVDAAIGTDTSGSGRRPALVNGVWQFRPSHNQAFLEGMIKTYPRFDTPCAFARDLNILKRVATTWISLTPQPTGLASRPLAEKHYEIIYPVDYFHALNKSQMVLIENFVGDMQSSLEATVVKLDIRDAWRRTHPEGAPDNVDEYLDDVVARTFYHGFYHSFDTFRKKYPEAHDGRPPYVIPFVHRRWEKGAAVTVSQSKEAKRRMEVYRRWWLDNFFHVEGKEVLIVLPIAKVEPNYRDTSVESPSQQSALDQLFLSPILGAPDVMIPIGEVPYESRISMRTEYLPVLVNVLGAPKSDLQLLNVVDRVMRSSRRPTVISTGPRMYRTAKE